MSLFCSGVTNGNTWTEYQMEFFIEVSELSTSLGWDLFTPT